MIRELQQSQTCHFDEPRQAQWEVEFAALLNAQLLNSPYYAVRRVLCEFRDGMVTLRGQVPSYFLKQVAQSVIRRGSKGAIPIDNRLEVVYGR